ncbi:hypothetical protein EZS27_005333 [termite gut metagenome]|uniref:Uncharacterized protein n=1 Tax=termite gut metagenome TaxID=433724 RepID=A0A5J4SLR6_9ZZZZ
MKTLDEKQRKEIADEVFKSYPRVQKVIVAADGQAFIADENDLAAKSHSKHNRYKKELELYTFRRTEPEKETSEKENPATVKEIIAQIEAAGTTEAVQAILEKEQNQEKPRKSVTEAATKKLETLEKQPS